MDAPGAQGRNSNPHDETAFPTLSRTSRMNPRDSSVDADLVESADALADDCSEADDDFADAREDSVLLPLAFGDHGGTGQGRHVSAVLSVQGEGALSHSRNRATGNPRVCEQGPSDGSGHELAGRSPYPRDQSQWRHVAGVLLLGQLTSLVNAGTGVASQAINTTYSVNAPLTQNQTSYLLMALIFVPILIYKGRFRASTNRWLFYLLLAIMDVEANFTAVLAYKYTNLTSVQLLDSFTIPFVIALAYFWLKQRFNRWQYFGAALCLCGIIGVFIYDSQQADASGGNANSTSSSTVLLFHDDGSFGTQHQFYTNSTAGDDSNGLLSGASPHHLRILGDGLCLVSAALYALTNVMMEKVLREKRPSFEYLAWIGGVGAVVNAIQWGAWEYPDLHRSQFSTPVVLLIAAFAACLVSMYALVPQLISRSNATVLNLSLLTTDFYAMIVGVFVFKLKFKWPYFLAFGLVVVGLATYGKNSGHTPPPIDSYASPSRAADTAELLPDEDNDRSVSGLDDSDHDVAIA